jgi:hypothetical protein
MSKESTIVHVTIENLAGEVDVVVHTMEVCCNVIEIVVHVNP